MAKGTDEDFFKGHNGRPLGFTETVDHHMTEKHNIGVFWHIFIVRTSHVLKDDDVTTAWKILLRKQEALQMRIISTSQEDERDLNFQFKPMDEPEAIDFEVMDVANKDIWPEIISQCHMKNEFDCVNGPLWKFILGRVGVESKVQDEAAESITFPFEYLFMLKIHHSICDGRSTFDLMYHQYLPILSALVNGADAENIIPFIPQSKPAEELFLTATQLKNPVPWYMKLGIDLFRWKNRTFKPPERPLYKFPDDVMPPEDDREKEPPCVPKVFGNEICVLLTESAKRHSVTVHCVLLSAGALAFCRTAMAAGITLPGSFKQDWAIDIRKHAGYDTPQPLAALNSNGTTEHKNKADFTMEEFWSACTKICPSVKAQCTQEKCTKFLGLPKYFVDALKSTPITTIWSEMGITPLLSLSNLGNTSAGPQPKMSEGLKKFRLTQHFFGLTGIACIDCVPLAQYVITFEEKIMWNVIHYPHRTSKRFVDTYLDHLEDVLKTYCQHG